MNSQGRLSSQLGPLTCDRTLALSQLPRKAHVRNGRLVLDEPTDLPEGTVVPLEIADDWDDLNDEERAALHRELAASSAERKAAAPTYDATKVSFGARLAFQKDRISIRARG
jgi:hypothetical protein